MVNTGMLIAMSFFTVSRFLLIFTAIAFIFGLGENPKKIKNISWSAPIPDDLLSRLREFSPVSISRTSGIYLDDVFDIMNGTRSRTAPEVIEKLKNTLSKLEEHDKELDREAAKMAYLIRGFDALEQKRQDRSKGSNALANKPTKKS